ncbi:MAG: hypothetical protein WBM84_17100 [Sedimenticolaceae bacterium]
MIDKIRTATEAGAVIGGARSSGIEEFDPLMTALNLWDQRL